ncbi:MAG: 2-oxoglutarate and iron-dependent oxygenase domain-containing protein [Hyphomicrobiaceae bacterium]|nr:2-oxoglutarate and iron-dependent oxygenase domain-containing protein [Hyphomicrobiaceae bacterium]
MQSPDNSIIPLVDIGALHEGGLEAKAAVARAIGEACRGLGFFYVVGHRVSEALVAQAFDMSRRFFALPEAEKERISIAHSPHNRGYIGFGGETLDPGKPADLKEAFNVGLELDAADPEVLAGKPFRGVNLWPGLAGFREVMLAYYDALWKLGRLMHQAFSIDLGLPLGYFDDKLDRPMAILRLLHYPAMPERLAMGQYGAGEHTDYGNITLLATDDVGGLEIRTRSGRWLAAPPMQGAFVCNIGDCLMRWSNDIYCSTPHRVVNRYGRERYSIAYFLDPNPDAVVGSLPIGAAQRAAPKYAPILAADFLRARLTPTYAHALPRN